MVETADKIFVVMELIQGGELFEYLLDRGPLPEAAAVHIMRQVMSAIAYLHSQGVVHRDLKAENLLVVDPTEDFPTVKLIDFGFATILRHNLTGSFLGTGGYLAPEIRQQRLYSESVDIWACGVLLYLLLSCRLPFTAEVELLGHNRQHLERKFELAFLPEALWKGRSESVRNLLRRMLAPDPMRRFTAQQVIRHPWILYGPAADQRHNTRPPPPPVPLPSRGAVAGGIRELLENPQESSGTGPGLLKRQNGGGGGGNGSAGAMPIPPPAAGAAGAREVVAADGAIRHVRSSLNLERMHQAPFPPGNHGNHPAPTMLSRTPPAVRRPPLRSSATMGAGQQASSGATLPQGPGGGKRAAPQQRQRQPQKPVLVSYLQQTLHSGVAGDLSSTSNLSMKYSGMASASKPRFNPHPSAAAVAASAAASAAGAAVVSASSGGAAGGERKV